MNDNYPLPADCLTGESYPAAAVASSLILYSFALNMS